MKGLSYISNQISEIGLAGMYWEVTEEATAANHLLGMTPTPNYPVSLERGAGGGGKIKFLNEKKWKIYDKWEILWNES